MVLYPRQRIKRSNSTAFIQNAHKIEEIGMTFEGEMMATRGFSVLLWYRD
jgi:hypothetical protein